MTHLITVRSVRSRSCLVFVCLALSCLILSVPLFADSVLNFPRLTSDSNFLTGVAIVNPTSSDASVTITAYGSNGSVLTGDGVTNPVTVTVSANQQFSKLTSELFGSIPSTSAAWFQASSSTDGLTGFFLFLNPSLTVMDGADVPSSGQKLIFNSIRIDLGFSTELNLVNPSSSEAHLSLQLAGTYFPPAAQSLTLPPYGASRLDAASFFSVSDIQPGAYVIVDSDADVAGFELVSSPSSDAFALNARRGAEKLGSLYFLRLAVLGSLNTQIALVNYSADPVVLTLSAYKTDGSLYDASSLQNNPVTRALNGKASLREDLQSMFGFSGSSPLDGWILVKATSDAVNGFVSYGDSSSGALAAVTSSAEGRTRALFSHIATSSGFSTGISLLNPGSVTANVRILALTKSADILGVFDTVLQPSQRFNRFLGTSDLIPAAANQTGGVIFIKSDQPVYMSALISSSSSSVDIPAQPAPDSYNPDSAISTLKMSPPIAIVPPGSSQRFTVSGSPSGLVWKVNGIQGGSASTGTISGGVFTAPKSVPARQVATITAETSSQAAGASADVLDKVPFTSGLGVIQSVTYLDTLGKIYSAELAALSSAPSLAPQTGNSQIFEVPPSGKNISVALFPNEVIAKIIPFTADNSTQFLLLAAQTSGGIIRLNPVTKDFKYVVTGLNQPSSLVIDPSSGDLLVVEADQISSVSKSTLQADLLAPKLPRSNAPGAPPASILFPVTGAAGITVDRCTGFIYYSFPDLGTIVEYHPAVGTSLTVASGLDHPGQLLGIYRANVTCPNSFQILVAEHDANRVSLVIPRDGIVTQWLESPGITDLAFVPLGNPDTPNEAIILADHTIEFGGIIYLVPLSNLYQNKPPNPPEQAQVESKVDLALKQSHDPNPVLAYQTLTFTITATNNGPDTATGVALTDTLPADASFISATSSQGNCGQNDALVNCNLGTIAAKASATVTVKVSPNYFADPSPRTLRNSAAVTSIEVDTDPSNNTSSEEATVTPPQAAKLGLSGLPPSIPAAVATLVTVTIKDQYGNVASSYNGTVRLTCSDSSAILPSSYTFGPGDAGSHTFSVTFRTPGSQTLTATDTVVTTMTATQSTTVLPAAAASFLFAASTTTPSSGFPFSATVTVRDATGNPAIGYAGTVRFTSSDTTGTLPAIYAFAPAENGVHTFTDGLTLRDIGTRTVTVTDASNPAVTATLTLTVVSPAVRYLVTSDSYGPAAGTAVIISAQLVDASSSPVPLAGIVVTWSKTGAGGSFGAPTSTTNASGIATVSFTTGTTAGTAYTVTGTDTSSLTGTTPNITTVAGTATKYLVTSDNYGPAAGAPVTISAQLADVYNNPVATASIVVTWSKTGAGGSFGAPTSTTNASGIATVSFTTGTTATTVYTVTGTDASGFTGTTPNITTVAGTATKYLVTSDSYGPVAGTAVTISAQLADVYNNPVHTAGIVVTWSKTGAGGFFATPTSSTNASGIATVVFTTGPIAGAVYTVTGTDAASLTGTSTNITTTFGPLHHLLVTGLPQATTSGTPQSVTVTAQDINGNTVTDYTGVVRFTSSSTSTSIDGSLVGSGITYTFDGKELGTRIFSATFNENTPVADPFYSTLTVEDTTHSLTPVVLKTVVGVASGAYAFRIFGPSTATAGLPFTVTVVAVDPGFSTIVFGYNGTITFSAPYETNPLSALPAGYTFVPGDSGVHTFTNGVTFITATSQLVNVSGTGVLNPGTLSVSVSAASAASLKVELLDIDLLPVVSLTFGAAPVHLRVIAQDTYGNTATSFNGSYNVLFSTTNGASLPPNGTYAFEAGTLTLFDSVQFVNPPGCGPIIVQSVTVDVTAPVLNGKSQDVSVGAPC